MFNRIDTDNDCFCFFFYSNKSYNEESLIDESWDGSVITTKEEKESCPMLSMHLYGGQFKRK